MTTYSYSIGTSTMSYYQRLMKEVEAMGFKQTTTQKLSDTQMLVTYELPKISGILLGVSTARASKDGVGDWTTWSVSLSATDIH